MQSPIPNEPRPLFVTGVAVLASSRLLSDLVVTALTNAPDLLVVASGTSVSELASAATGAGTFALAFDGSTPEAMAQLGDAVAALRPTHLVVFGVDGVPEVLRAHMSDGSVSVVERSGSLAEVVNAIRRTAGNASSLDADTTLTVASAPLPIPRARRTTKHLTCREREVARLLARGLSNAEICRALDIRPGTLKAHVHSVYLKLGVSRRDEIDGQVVEPVASRFGPEAGEPFQPRRAAAEPVADSILHDFD